MIFRFNAFALVFLLTACTKTPAGADYLAMSQKICNCFEPVRDFEALGQMAIVREETERLEWLASKYIEIEQMEKRCDSLWQDITRALEADEQNRLMEVMETTCYDTALRVQQD